MHFVYIPSLLFKKKASTIYSREEFQHVAKLWAITSFTPFFKYLGYDFSFTKQVESFRSL